MNFYEIKSENCFYATDIVETFCFRDSLIEARVRFFSV